MHLVIDDSDSVAPRIFYNRALETISLWCVEDFTGVF